MAREPMPIRSVFRKSGYGHGRVCLHRVQHGADDQEPHAENRQKRTGPESGSGVHETSPNVAQARRSRPRWIARSTRPRAGHPVPAGVRSKAAGARLAGLSNTPDLSTLIGLMRNLKFNSISTTNIEFCLYIKSRGFAEMSYLASEL